ncbi:unnamed protein product, partial [Prorocentrum cordatum]
PAQPVGVRHRTEAGSSRDGGRQQYTRLQVGPEKRNKNPCVQAPIGEPERCKRRAVRSEEALGQVAEALPPSSGRASWGRLPTGGGGGGGAKNRHREREREEREEGGWPLCEPLETWPRRSPACCGRARAGTLGSTLEEPRYRTQINTHK